ncbi:hypothetical protein ACLOJK_037529 [Asimina triloba]
MKKEKKPKRGTVFTLLRVPVKLPLRSMLLSPEEEEGDYVEDNDEKVVVSSFFNEDKSIN